MEAYTTEQINILLLIGAYIFVMGAVFWNMTKPR